MSITKKLALRHLKQNKTRSVLTVLGITISVVMLTVIFTCATSFAHYYGERAINTNGNWHFFVKTDYESAKKYLLSDSSLKDIGFEKDLSTEEQSYKIYSDKANYIRTGTIYQGDAQYIKDTVTCKYDGALPKSDNEIMVEQSLIKNNGLELKIGDEIKIAVGSRLKGDFVILPIKGNYQFGERFEKEKDETFKVVGILHDNEPTERGAIIRGMSDLKSKNLVAYGKIKKVTPFSYIKINGIYDKFGFTKKKRAFNVGENTGFLNSRLAFSIDKNDLPQVLKLTAIGIVVFAVIFVSSFAMIYNSFALSVGEQIKYLGMLSSVGATRKQKKKTLYFEGAILGGIGIILGIVLGLLTTFISQSAMNAKIMTIMEGYNDNIKYSTHISLWVLCLIVILAALTVFVSIISPVQKAARITAIDAIRKTDEIKRKGKIRTPFIITKLFGFEGDIAFKNLRRNGRKSRTIIACICICAVLFLSCNYFCETFKEASNLDYELPYQLTFQYSAESKAQLEKARNYLKTNKRVKRFYSIWEAWYSILRGDINPYDNSRLYDMSFQNESIFVDKYKFIATQDITYTAHLLDDEDFNALCKKNGIDYKKYYSPDKDGSIKTIVINGIDRNDEPIFNNNLLGKTIGCYDIDSEKTERENKLDENGNQVYFYYKTGCTSIYKFCDFIKYDKDNPICNLDSSGVAFYAPKCVYDKYSDDDSFYFDYGIETDEPYKVEKELKDYLSENEAEGDVYNNYNWMMKEKSIISAVQFLSYAFILLITLITVFNIINTMTAQIAGRKKELAMLKSVGMTPKEFKKTLIFESMFYGLFGLLFGVPLSLVINRVVGYIILKDNPIPFSVNIWLYLIACVAVFVIIGLTMIYSLKLIKNNSIIDSLKDDTN
jgi:putative ABC transport system permease protein|nr:MAG TPA: ABC-type transport system, permease component [Caudoviricetes sp.]